MGDFANPTAGKGFQMARCRQAKKRIGERKRVVPESDHENFLAAFILESVVVPKSVTRFCSLVREFWRRAGPRIDGARGGL
jgi:hypothetical protein